MQASYIATFYTHHDALVFTRAAQRMNVSARLMPVPRRISSSCGTGACFCTDIAPAALLLEGVEKIYRDENGVFALVCQREDAE